MKTCKFFLFFLILLTQSSSIFAAKDTVLQIKKLFRHEQHKEAFSQRRLDCVSCHPMSKKLSASEEVKFKDKRNNSCHQCHNSPDGLASAPTRCQTCHSEAPKDDRHMLTMWKKNHGMAAKQDQKDCAKCHEPQDCTTCHSGQEALQRDMHPRSFIMTHAISARMNSRTCVSCHQTSYCVNCHMKEDGK